MKTKLVIVPQEDIDRLEEARIKLWELAKEFSFGSSLTFNITDILWKITHKKYQKFGESIGRFSSNISSTQSAKKDTK